MDKDNILDRLETQNEDVKLVKTAINDYKEWCSLSNYTQGDAPVPLLFKITTLFFWINNVSYSKV